MTNKLQTEFDETIGKDGGEKQFIKSLTETFIILLNTKVDSVDKITKKTKSPVSTVVKIWSGQD